MITAATYQQSMLLGNDQYKIRVRLTDDVAGIFDEWFTVSGDTLAELRNALTAQIVARNSAKSRGNLLAGIAVGFVIPLTLPASPAPSAKAVWIGKVNRYRQFAGMGLTGAAATALTALLTDINATYVAGHLD